MGSRFGRIGELFFRSWASDAEEREVPKMGLDVIW